MPTRPSQPYRCVQCRTRFASQANQVAHEQRCTRPLCTCGGYHYKHRPGSPYCWSNPRSALLEAERRGESAEVLAEIEAWIESQKCPF